MKKVLAAAITLLSISSYANNCRVEVNFPLLKDQYHTVDNHDECIQIAEQSFGSIAAISFIDGKEIVSEAYYQIEPQRDERGWKTNGLRYSIHGGIIGDRRTKEQIKNPDRRKRNRFGELID